MRIKPQPDAPVADVPVPGPVLTDYDLEHAIHYLRMLDAHAEGADWREVAKIVLQRDHEADELGAVRCYQTHLARAQWMTEQGFRQLLLDAANDVPGGGKTNP
jgi:hypothetical protein